jgi:hypothetical protein
MATFRYTVTGRFGPAGYLVVALDTPSRAYEASGEPLWDPTSTRFAAYHRRKVHLYDRSGEKLATPALECTRAELAWSADGRAVFACELGDDRSPGPHALHVLDGPQWRRLAVLPYSSGIVDLAPDGKWLLVAGQGDLVAVSTADGRIVRITDGAAVKNCFVARVAR